MYFPYSNICWGDSLYRITICKEDKSVQSHFVNYMPMSASGSFHCDQTTAPDEALVAVSRKRIVRNIGNCETPHIPQSLGQARYRLCIVCYYTKLGPAAGGPSELGVGLEARSDRFSEVRDHAESESAAEKSEALQGLEGLFKE